MKRLCVAVATMTKCVPMEHAFVQEVFITPLGPKSDQHQYYFLLTTSEIIKSNGYENY